MDKRNWAKLTQKTESYAAAAQSKAAKAKAAKASAKAARAAAAAAIGGGASAADAQPSQALVAASRSGGGAFIVPRPGLNGAVAGQFSGKRFVTTGIFPELGGGATSSHSLQPRSSQLVPLASSPR